MNDAKIAKLIASRNRLTDRRDGLTDSKRVAAIDAQLAAVPAGERNDVDLLLGRLRATPTPRADYSDLLRDKCAAVVDVLERDWIQSQTVTTERAAPLAEAMQRKYAEWSAGQPDGIVEHDDRDAGMWK